ncbi:zinc ribbon domain-containing protein [Nocardioides guangzhouensis]|uniref:Zinc ribbon domain-containing protein n=1 Tax=Nocardioides guangzhouensis TaxID=2497878 RepID=A0A4Q4ZCG7_9ACTN|nr:zinc ribbon domain-containing protein [Nocardioides guangzhouensis]RYP85697.1 zinc ribbon domain-containing protein [Nocardioides guangzhouensis]
MNFCTNCGQQLVVGRFCTHCGAPTGAETTPDGRDTAPHDPVQDTAERPAGSPRPAAASPTRQVPRAPVTPPTAQTGEASRYPLFADEVDATRQVTPVPPGPPADPTPHREGGPRRAVPLAAVLAVLALVVVVALSVWLLGGGDDEPQNASGDRTSSGPDGTGSPKKDPTTPEQPIGSPDDLAPESTVQGPKPLAPGTDLNGNRVAYPPENMLDDDLATAYRMPGDASGATITFTLPRESVISEVGMVNGYAKKDSTGGRTVDWYRFNRKILQVEWVFDDGTSIVQRMRTEPVLQTIVVDKVRTRSIQLRINEVSEPGAGRLRKNVTAISDVLLRGDS